MFIYNKFIFAIYVDLRETRAAQSTGHFWICVAVIPVGCASARLRADS